MIDIIDGSIIVSYKYEQQPTNRFGLKHEIKSAEVSTGSLTCKKETDPMLFDWSKSNDMYGDLCPKHYGEKCTAVSERNIERVRSLVENLNAKRANRMKVIVEIGVDGAWRKYKAPTRNFTHTAFLGAKDDDVLYVGIDIRSVQHLMSEKLGYKNIKTIQSDTREIEEVEKQLKDLGVEEIDILMIDGHHSVTICQNDFHYAKHVAKDGVILMHDTNAHPGPMIIFDAIDEKIFNKEKLFTDVADSGLAVVTYK